MEIDLELTAKSLKNTQRRWVFFNDFVGNAGGSWLQQ